MRVKLRFFALYRELVGRGEDEVELPPGSTLAHLRQRVKGLYPRLAPHPLAFAVNGEHQEDGFALSHGDQVAFLPPFSGGQSG